MGRIMSALRNLYKAFGGTPEKAVELRSVSNALNAISDQLGGDSGVPITAVDLITMYGVILDMRFKSGMTAINSKVDPTTTDGRVTANTAATSFIVSAPVKAFDVGSSAAALNYYFVPAYDYEGIFYNGEKITPTGATVEADGRSLYCLTISGGSEKTFAITKLGY